MRLEVGKNSYALDLLETFSGSIICTVEQPQLSAKPLRTLARIVSDESFPDMGNEPSKYHGTIFRFQRYGPNTTVTGFLTRKEALFGEFGRPDHDALVTFTRTSGPVIGDLVVVTYQDLYERDLEYLQQLLLKMGLREIK